MLNLPLALRRYRATTACLALLVVVASPVTPTLAQDSSAQEVEVRAKVSEDAAVAMVRKQTDGKVIRVDRKLEGDSLVYRIRVLSPDGRLREFRVDAATGTMR
jgi:uncharacterized membrane protein YkoI